LWRRDNNKQLLAVFEGGTGGAGNGSVGSGWRACSIPSTNTAGIGAFGQSLALGSATKTLIIGVPEETVQGLNAAGSAFVFDGFGGLFSDGFENRTQIKAAPPPGCD